MDELKKFAELAAAFLETFGIGIIILIGIFSTATALYKMAKGSDRDEIFRRYRHQFGKGILLGLEFLVGADIIHTVAVDLSYRSIGVLGLIVLVRTFLSFTLELEITGRWPWEHK